MITFSIRLGIILVAIFCTAFTSFAFNVNPLGILCVLICSWLTIISFKYVFWWIFALSVIFGLLYYDIFGLFTMSIICVAFLFNLIYVQAVRSANDSPLILYCIAFLLSIIVVTMLEIVVQHYLFFNLYEFIVNIIVTFSLFFLFRFSIGRAERFINLYAHGADMRCHT